ncbi:MAG: VIT and VWA domain-containing protein, partial [bacterium]
MKNIIFLLILITSSLSLLADGMLLQPRPELPAFSVTYHTVDVNIDRQIAKTEIDQVFHNESNIQTEGTYMFPIDDNKTISKFIMYAGNEELKNRILEKDEAAKIYNNIVRQRKDPALLQWINKRMIQARVFPIEPNGDKRIKLGYQEALTAQNNVIKYVYPMKTEMISSKPLSKCTVRVNIISDKPLINIYSPTHKISVKRIDDYHAEVAYFEENVLPDQDFVFYYSFSTLNIGADLLAYTEAGTKDGYFIMMVAPQFNIPQTEVQPKDTIFVLDTSGSMSGDKINQAKSALKY